MYANEAAMYANEAAMYAAKKPRTRFAPMTIRATAAAALGASTALYPISAARAADVGNVRGGFNPRLYHAQPTSNTPAALSAPAASGAPAAIGVPPATGAPISDPTLSPAVLTNFVPSPTSSDSPGPVATLVALGGSTGALAALRPIPTTDQPAPASIGYDPDAVPGTDPNDPYLAGVSCLQGGSGCPNSTAAPTLTPLSAPTSPQQMPIIERDPYFDLYSKYNLNAKVGDNINQYGLPTGFSQQVVSTTQYGGTNALIVTDPTGETTYFYVDDQGMIVQILHNENAANGSPLTAQVGQVLNQQVNIMTLYGFAGVLAGVAAKVNPPPSVTVGQPYSSYIEGKLTPVSNTTNSQMLGNPLITQQGSLVTDPVTGQTVLSPPTPINIMTTVDGLEANTYIQDAFQNGATPRTAPMTAGTKFEGHLGLELGQDAAQSGVTISSQVPVTPLDNGTPLFTADGNLLVTKPDFGVLNPDYYTVTVSNQLFGGPPAGSASSGQAVLVLPAPPAPPGSTLDALGATGNMYGSPTTAVVTAAGPLIYNAFAQSPTGSAVINLLTGNGSAPVSGAPASGLGSIAGDLGGSLNASVGSSSSDAGWGSFLNLIGYTGGNPPAASPAGATGFGLSGPVTPVPPPPLPPIHVPNNAGTNVVINSDGTVATGQTNVSTGQGYTWLGQDNNNNNIWIAPDNTPPSAATMASTSSNSPITFSSITTAPNPSAISAAAQSAAEAGLIASLPPGASINSISTSTPVITSSTTTAPVMSSAATVVSYTAAGQTILASALPPGARVEAVNPYGTTPTAMVFDSSGTIIGQVSNGAVVPLDRSLAQELSWFYQIAPTAISVLSPMAVNTQSPTGYNGSGPVGSTGQTPLLTPGAAPSGYDSNGAAVNTSSPTGYNSNTAAANPSPAAAGTGDAVGAAAVAGALAGVAAGGGADPAVPDASATPSTYSAVTAGP